MKNLFLCTGLLMAATAVYAQPAPMHAPSGPPKSPAATETANLAGKAISITYSSPRVNGRTGHIFSKDGLISKDPNYPIWRAGANAATKLHTDADLTIGELNVPKGDYTLYINLADPDNWELIINKQIGQWGLTHDAAQDLGVVKMTMAKPAAPIENLKYAITDLGGGAGKLTLEWENYSASVPLAAH